MRVIITILVLCAATFARADATEEARKYFEAGRQAYEAGQYAASINAFEEAYKLSPRSSIVFALGQSYRRQYSIDRDGGKLVRAGALYRQYLAEVKQGERRDEAARYLGEIEPLLLQIEGQQQAAPTPVAPTPVSTQLMISSQTKGARGSIDGGPAGEIPVIADVKPGSHKVRVEAEGYFPADGEATAVDGRLVVAELNLKEKPAELVIDAPPGAEIVIDGRPASGKLSSVPAGKHLVTVTRRGHLGWSREVTLGRGERKTLTATTPKTTQRKAAYGVFAGSLALVAVAGVTGIVNLSKRSSANDLESKIEGGTGTAEDLAEHNRLADDAGSYATATRVLFGAATAVAITGALLYYFDTPRAESSAIVPTITAGGGGAAWVTRF